MQKYGEPNLQMRFVNEEVQGEGSHYYISWGT
jgi:hypothetical protein